MTATVGVDIGGTKILGVVLEADAEAPLVEERVPTPRGDDALIESVATVVEGLRSHLPTVPITAVGVGAPGLVDRGGVLRMGPNLPDVFELDVAGRLSPRLGLPVAVDNDATCAAWAEHERGACRNAGDAVVITLGTGIGAGLIADGRLVRGANGMAGEPGHMIVDPDGPPCPCGRRGCWERYASGSGLARLAREAAIAGRARTLVARAGGDPEAVRGEHVTAAAREGEPEALAVVEHFGWWVALGLANLVNVLDPAVVVIGGGLVAEGELLLEPTRRAFRGHVLASDHRPEVAIRAAALGEQAGAFGAALIAADRLPVAP